MKTTVEYIRPIRIITQKKVIKASQLLKENQLQIGLNEKAYTTIKPGGYLILDFGKQIAGGLRILNFEGNGRLHLRLGESVSESCSSLNVDNSTNDHSTRDAIVLTTSYSDMTYFQSGFRFVRIDSLDQENIKLKAIVAKFEYADLKRVGTFVSSDELLNRIFSVAADTVHLNIQNQMIWDGIKRDRLVWIGDIHPEMLAATGLFADTKFIENSLDFIKSQTSLNEWMNGIPMYSMWYLIIMYDYYMRKGNIKYVKKNLKYIEGVTKHLLNHINPEGKMTFPYYFLDWPTHDQADEISGIEALCKWAFNCAKELLKLGNKSIDSLEGIRFVQDNEAQNAKQAIALRILQKLPQTINNLTEKGSKGFSTFMAYYILKAIVKTNSTQEAVTLMKEYYGAMLNLGATTFFEDFDIDWAKNAQRIDEMPRLDKIDFHQTYGSYSYKKYRHSLCHGWSAGVIPFLQEEVLGVHIVDAGYRKIQFKPQFGELDYLDATLPTPYGIITIRHRNNQTTISVPKGVEVI